MPWANSLWHIDSHHSLIRWKFVIHGCCDGFSRKIMFLKCSTNNLATTVLQCFEEAINQNGELWPSRVRVDHGVENVLVCDAMVGYRGEGRGSFIAGPSTRNQRIERLWRRFSVRVPLFLLSLLCHGANWLFRSGKSRSYVRAAYCLYSPHQLRFK